MADADEEEKLELRFSHNIIEHLGLKLYQNKPTNVLAELVSNSWDADAKHVWVTLRNATDGTPASIAVADNGEGMSKADLAGKYLIVGKPKRNKNTPAERSPGGRVLMGRKGIGKLAPFGVARTVDLLTCKGGQVSWLRFDYDKIRGEGENAEPGELATYRPILVYKDSPLDGVDSQQGGEERETVSAFLKNVADSPNKSGTLVLASRLTLKRQINPATLKESLGRRFTVTLARADFDVRVNEQSLSSKDVFPDWDLRIPETGTAEEDVQTPDGVKKVKYWVGFVKEASWPAEQAGVGIYAHGKIAQDRPYFFEIKGVEVFTRYMYGVVEADWIDELSEDAISTDRTSIDWQNEAFADLKVWGAKKVRSWVSAYQALRKDRAGDENSKLIDEAVERNAGLQIRPTEKAHLLGLLNEVTPRLTKDPEPKAKFVEAAMRAWVHDPARRLIKKLWEEAADIAPDQFVGTVMRLADELVPESLSLAVVFSQRVYALHKLQDRIAHGKETNLQALIEEFPWILSQAYERFFARRELKTICEEAEASGEFTIRPVYANTEQAQKTKPDFVFLGTPEDRNILVVELKSPNETAGHIEHEQLYSYVSYLTGRFASSTVEGILVARDFSPSIGRLKTELMQHLDWDTLLKRSRRNHMELLAALLGGVEADANDSRVQQICELGGEPVRDFLKDMASADDRFLGFVKKLEPKLST